MVDEAFNKFCTLMDIEESQMETWLAKRKIVSVKESVTKSMSARDAQFGRDALAKKIYANLFDFIVKAINRNLASSVDAPRCVGILDIYGFETFEINSFEQLCINYANEKLQQQFCLVSRFSIQEPNFGI
jgi:myosin-5